MSGWEAGTRTPIRRSRVCSLTIRRPPRARTYFSIGALRGAGELDFFRTVRLAPDFNEAPESSAFQCLS